jgi:hypothetical protein
MEQAVDAALRVVAISGSLDGSRQARNADASPLPQQRAIRRKLDAAADGPPQGGEHDGPRAVPTRRAMCSTTAWSCAIRDAKSDALRASLILPWEHASSHVGNGDRPLR